LLSRRHSTLLAFMGVVWAVAVSAGFTLLWRYKSTPAAEDAVPPVRWPTASRIARVAGRSALVMFVHPRCPCTRASVAELGRLMGVLGDRVSAHVRVLRPPDASADWDHTAVWERASAVPGVIVAPDDGGEAALFNAVTSGQTLLYDATGQLRFNGGLTSARGHEGDSVGRRMILAQVMSGTADRADGPVFGCSLIGPPAGREPPTAAPATEVAHEHR
jgi:hypothetical protein